MKKRTKFGYFLNLNAESVEIHYILFSSLVCVMFENVHTKHSEQQKENKKVKQD